VQVILALAIWIISWYGRCRESVVGQYLLKGELQCNYRLKDKNSSIAHFTPETQVLALKSEQHIQALIEVH